MKDIPQGAAVERQIRKLRNRARYQRHYTRNAPPPKSKSYPAELRLTARSRAACVLRGVPEYLQRVAELWFGKKGTWGHGKQPNGTRKGPGIRPLPRNYRPGENEPLLSRTHPAGTKIVRGFIRRSRRESRHWRSMYAELTGKHYG